MKTKVVCQSQVGSFSLSKVYVLVYTSLMHALRWISRMLKTSLTCHSHCPSLKGLGFLVLVLLIFHQVFQVLAMSIIKLLKHDIQLGSNYASKFWMDYWIVSFTSSSLQQGLWCLKLGVSIMLSRGQLITFLMKIFYI